MGQIVYQTIPLEPGQTRTLTAAAMFNGVPAPFDPEIIPTWASDPEDIVELTVDITGYICDVLALLPGITLVTVSTLSEVGLVKGYANIVVTAPEDITIANQFDISVGALS